MPFVAGSHKNTVDPYRSRSSRVHDSWFSLSKFTRASSVEKRNNHEDFSHLHNKRRAYSKLRPNVCDNKSLQHINKSKGAIDLSRIVVTERPWLL